MAARKTPRAGTGAKIDKASAGRTALVVLGMHRSGNTAMAAVLGQMGCDLPKSLTDGAEGRDPTTTGGDRIAGLNEHLLASAGASWFSLPRFPQDWFASPKAGEYLERARDAIAAEYGRSHLFVLKDPRICRLLPLWQRALQTADCRPAYVCIHRHPQHVAASLTRWANCDPAFGLLLWLRHVLDAEAESRGQTRVFTSYDRLMADWAGTVRGIGTGLGLRWPRSLEAAVSGDAALGDARNLRADRQHFRQTGSDKGAPGLPDWVTKTYDILERWAAVGERPADHKTLDRIRAGLDHATPSFAAVSNQSQQRWLEVQHLQQRIAQLESAAQGTEARIADLSNALGQGLEQATAQAADLRSELVARADAEVQIVALFSALESARTETQGLAARHDSAQLARHAAEARIANLSDALHLLQQQDETRIAQVVQDLEMARAEGAEHAAGRQSAQQAHGAADARVAELSTALDQARTGAEARIADLAGQLEQVRAAQDAGQIEAERALAEARGAALDLRDGIAKGETALQALHGEKAALDEALRRSDEDRTAAEDDAYQQRNALIQRSHEADDLHRQVTEDARRIAEIDAALTDMRRDHAALLQQDQRNRAHLDVMTRRLTEQLRQDLENRLRVPVDHAARDRERAALIAAYETRLTRLQRAHDAGQATLARSLDDTAALSAAADSLRDQVVQRRHEIFALSKRLDTSQQDLAIVSEQSDNTKAAAAMQTAALQNQLQALEADRDALQKAAETLKVKLGKAGYKEDQLQGHLKQRQQDVKNIRQELVAVTRRLRECQNLVASLQEARSAQDQRERALEARVEAMLASASWKVTRPVRAVSLVFRRGPPKSGA